MMMMIGTHTSSNTNTIASCIGPAPAASSSPELFGLAECFHSGRDARDWSSSFKIGANYFKPKLTPKQISSSSLQRQQQPQPQRQPHQQHQQRRNRFKVTEEFPPYLRSVLLERLLPATKYNLQVTAVYLDGRFRRTSQRVHFISPTDNESRRFKENTYRPIHSYPDEQREIRVGLAHVRCEELTLVGIALLVWIGCICLFFKKWGKIRMLEPYQPAYREQLDVAGVTVGGPSTPPQMQLGSVSTGVATPSFANQPAAASPSESLLNLGKHQHQQQPPQRPQQSASPTALQSTGGTSSPVTPGGRAAQATTPGGRDKHDVAAAVGEQQQQQPALTTPQRRSAKAGACLPPTATPSHLNYLFQSKAQALAKASLMWPTLAAGHKPRTSTPASGAELHQKLRQEQYGRAKFGGMSVTSTTNELETLRRLGECLAARRHLSRIASGAGPSGPPMPLSAPFSQPGGPLERMSSKHMSCDSTLEAQQQQYKLLHHRLYQQHQQAIRTSSNKSATSNMTIGGAYRQLSSLDKGQQDAFEKLTAELERSRPSVPTLSPQSSRTSRTRQTTGGQSGDANDEMAEPKQVAAASRQQAGQEAEAELGQQQQRSVSSAGTARSQLMMSRLVRRNPAIDYSNLSHRESLRMATQSLDQSKSDSMASDRRQGSESQDQVSGGSQQQSSNRLRRLQFVSKIHQHHHIAQSMSSSALHQDRPTFDSSSRASSLSFERSSDVQFRELLEEGRRSRDYERRVSQQSQQRLSLKPDSLDLASRQLQPHLVEHQILIEPPSPPNNKQALILQEAAAGNQRAAAASAAAAAASAKEATSGEESSESNLEGLAESSRTQQLDYQEPEFDEIETENQIALVDQYDNSSSSNNNNINASQPEICLEDLPLREAERQQQQQQQQQQQSSPEQVGATTTSHYQHHDQTRANRQDAFQKLADSYRQSTERRLSRLAYASSSGQLSSVGGAGCWSCGSGQFECGLPPSSSCGLTNTEAELGHGRGQQATGALCFGQRNQSLSAGEQTASSSFRKPRRLFSVCAPATSSILDEHFLKPGTSGGGSGRAQPCAGPTLKSSPSRNSLNVSPKGHSNHQQQQQQQQHAQTLARRARRCSYCNSVECANQQASLAINQMRAIQIQQQRGLGRPASAAAAVPPSEELQSGHLIGGSHRARVSSVFACSPYNRNHRRDSFAMLRALSQKKSKSAEDIAYLSSLVLQIWTREPNPLLQNVSQLQASREQTSCGGTASSRRRSSINLNTVQHSQAAPSSFQIDRRRRSAGQNDVNSGPATSQQQLGASKRKRP